MQQSQKAISTRISWETMNSLSKSLLLSVKPQYSELIFAGRKKAELRRTSPPDMESREAFIYVTSPVMQLTGGFHVDEVLAGTPEEVWSKVAHYAGVPKSEFDAYYAGRSVAYALKITEVWQYEHPVRLAELRDRFDNFVVPQSWRYVTPEEQTSFKEMQRISCASNHYRGL